MTTDAFGRTHEQAAYQTAMASTDVHTGHCPVCSTGVACGRADDLMTDEYRAIEQWRQVDPARADAYDRATWPTTKESTDGN